MEARRPPIVRPYVQLVGLSALLFFSACTSVQWLDSHGQPRVFGLADSTPLPSDPTVTRTTAAGLSLRLFPGMVGYSIGWRETVLFQVGPDGDRLTIAFADRCYGVALDVGRIMLGSEQRFGVFQPEGASSVIQQIDYSESGFVPTRVLRQEVQ